MPPRSSWREILYPMHGPAGAVRAGAAGGSEADYVGHDPTGADRLGA